MLLVLALYRIEDKQDVLAFLSHRDGKLFIAAAISFACASVVASLTYIKLGTDGRRPLQILVKWNILPLAVVLAIGEGSLRAFSTDTPEGPLLGEQLLGPRRLTAFVAQYSEKFNRLLYYDQLLGWTVRPNLSSSNGLYFTSLDGIRDFRSGGTFASVSPTCRIALVGDSHTFGLELKFEETWGYELEAYLPKGCKVLNFGVEGYSLGQMYLRFLRDVRPWHPTIVILALSSHSSARTMGVYGLNSLGPIPWAQPRFELTDHALKPINVPLPPLEAIVTASTVKELPFIDHDWFFVPGMWELPRWRHMYTSYLFRAYITWFSLWRTQHNGNSAEAINHALLRAFLDAAKADGSTPVIVYLPDKSDYNEYAGKETPSLSVLRTSGVDYVDLRPCLDHVNADDRFLAQGNQGAAHYSLKGSSAIARCVVDRLPPFKGKTRSSS